MEMTGGPDAKKARWSPNSFTASNATPNGTSRDLFANYGYGAQAAINQANATAFSSLASNGLSSLGGQHSQQHLYSTPSLTVNTAASLNGSGGMGAQMSPSSATSPFTPSLQMSHQTQQGQQQQGQQNGYSGFSLGNYGMNGMLGMGMNGMGGMGSMGMLGVGGFPYSPQVASFQQVRVLFIRLKPVLNSQYRTSASSVSIL